VTTQPVQELSGKDRRLFRAAKMYYADGLKQEEIADRLGLSHSTVRNYFSSGDIQRFKRFYSDMEKHRLKMMLEQQVKDGYDLSNGLIGQALEGGDVSARDKLRASKLAMENRQRLVELLQELGVLEPGADPQGTEEGEGGGVEISFELFEEEEESEEQELEA